MQRHGDTKATRDGQRQMGHTVFKANAGGLSNCTNAKLGGGVGWAEACAALRRSSRVEADEGGAWRAGGRLAIRVHRGGQHAPQQARWGSYVDEAQKTG